MVPVAADEEGGVASVRVEVAAEDACPGQRGGVEMGVRDDDCVQATVGVDLDEMSLRRREGVEGRRTKSMLSRSRYAMQSQRMLPWAVLISMARSPMPSWGCDMWSARVESRS